MSFHTTDRDGITRLNPDIKAMQSILASLQDDSYDDPDVWLTHDSGWTLSFFPSGLAMLENEHSQTTTQLENVNPEQALQMWVKLSQGNIETLLQENWQPVNTQ